MKLSETTQAFIKLILRSNRDADGWASVSEMLWKATQQGASTAPELFELGDRKIRLTPTGETIARYV